MGKYLKVIFVDLFSLLIGITSGFLLPKFLSIESYSVVRTFGLYIGYCTVLHFGFSDGVYIILGGKNLSIELKKKIRGYFNTLLKIVLFSTLLLFIANIFLKNYYLAMFLLYTIPCQVNLFLSMVYRALNELRYYTWMRELTNIFTLISIFLCIIYSNAYLYINSQIIIQYIIMIIFLIHFFKNFKDTMVIKVSEINYIAKIGISLLVGNLIYNLIFSMDRWFVKILFDSTDFAFYSFGVSILNLFIVLINSVSVILYPYLCKHLEDKESIMLIKKALLMISAFSMGGFFILKIIVEQFLKQYVMSLDVLSILIACIPFITVVNALYCNLYRAYHRTKRYSKVSFLIFIIGFLFNCVLIISFREPSMLAFGSLFSFIIWYVISNNDFKELIITPKEFIWMFSCILAYVVLNQSNQMEIINFMLFYLITGVICIACFYKDLKQIVQYIKQIIKEKKTSS